MRRKDREIRNPSAILDILRSLPIGHLAMSDSGKPYGVTMNYFAETRPGLLPILFFHGAKSGRKAEILARNPAVYFFAERDDGRKDIVREDGSRSVTNLYVSVAGEGVMFSVDDPAEKRRVLLAMANAFSTDSFDYLPDAVLEMTAVWGLELTSLTGKSNPPPTS